MQEGHKMIEKLEKEKEKIQMVTVLVVTAAGVFKHEIFDVITVYPLMSSYFAMDETTSSLIYLLFLIFIYIGLKFMAHWSVDNWLAFRCCVMGHDNIEGAWLGVVYNCGRIIRGSYIYIMYSEGGYAIEGNCYSLANSKCDKQIGFNGKSSEYRERKLEYKYEAKNINNKEITHSGHGHYKFSGSHCVDFIGDFSEDHNESASWNPWDQVATVSE
jgi:hypothetical protein